MTNAISNTLNLNNTDEANELRLSVLMITYNHEKFIEQALRSILMQKTDFPFEIVIGDDCSSDGTRAIILDFAAKYPGKFKLLLHDRNMGMMQNFFSTLKACNSKYIAICEGDDYWIDPEKLQKQVNFLENNANFSMCCHNVFAEEEDGNRSVLWQWDEIKYFTLSNLANGNFISTPSVVFLKTKFSVLHDKYLEAPFGDFILHLFNARAGNICYMPDIMAVYRIHNQGVWTTRKSSTEKEIVLYTKFLHTNRMLLADFSDVDECRKSFNNGITESLNQLRFLHAKGRDAFLSRKFARMLLCHLFKIRKFNLHTFASCLLNVFFYKCFIRKIESVDETHS